MKKVIKSVMEQNCYGLFFKAIGIGFQFIGISLIFQNNYPAIYIILGMCTGLIFIGIGEVISLLSVLVMKGK